MISMNGILNVCYCFLRYFFFLFLLSSHVNTKGKLFEEFFSFFCKILRILNGILSNLSVDVQKLSRLQMAESSCCICGEEVRKDESLFSKLTEKGCLKINQIDPTINAKAGLKVHKKCRLDLLRPRGKMSVTTCEEKSSSTRRRSTDAYYNSSEHCLFCGQPSKYDGKKKGFNVMISVRTLEFQETILRQCKDRSDEWAMAVRGRLEHLRDLHAADAVYHQQCSSNFLTGKNITLEHSIRTESSSKKAKIQGRPVDSVRSSAFSKVIAFLEENDDEQPTIDDLVNKMEEFLESEEDQAYSPVYMKKKLEEHFGERILITTVRQKPNVVTFYQNVASILHDFYEKPRSEDLEEERFKIIETAATLIKNEIKRVDCSKEYFPASSELSSEKALEFLPALLQTFLQAIVTGKDVQLKIASLGQAIMQAARPRALIAPLQLGLGVQMHHQFGSKFLIDSLNSHGFCSSYSTVQKFERSAAVAHGVDVPGWIPGRFMQFSADNVDHNIRTLDGEGTFHGMGIVASITPATNTSTVIPCKEVTSEEISKSGRVAIRPYNGPCEDASKLLFKELQKLNVKDSTANLDLLWKLSLPLLRNPKPGWNGTMQSICIGTHPGQSTIMFLPMIDMDHTDTTCIYSSLSFICDQASRYEVSPIVTFDQPLYWKALTITQQEPEGSPLKSVVLMLGGLHTRMSFLGSIGYIMAGSGLEDMLELVYAKNTTIHMLSGKAIARAIRGHLLIDQALNSLIACKALGLPVPFERDQDGNKDEDAEPPQQPAPDIDMLDLLNDDDGEAEPQQQPAPDIDLELLNDDDREAEPPQQPAPDIDLELLKQLCKTSLETPQTSGQEISSSCLDSAKKKIKETIASLSGQRTAVLWLQYMEMVDILRKFIKGERTGDWKLHLEAIHDMLPYFAASGHNQYTKSAYYYLQIMQNLETSHPSVYKRFLDGLYVVRRTDRFWGGLSADLIIEQVSYPSLVSHFKSIIFT